MKTSAKIGFSCLLVMILSMSVFLAFTVVNIQKNGDKEIAQYREDELHKKKDGLKSYVDIAYSVIESNYNNATSQIKLQQQYGQRLVNIIETVGSMLASKSEQAKAGKISLEEAKKQAAEEIKKIRYDDGTGYVWINDMGAPYPKMIMHPTVPSLDGKVLDDRKFDCALGKGQNLFQAFVDVCRENGDGFVDYLWPKPTKNGLLPNVPKLSYVKLFKDWDWVIGTGIYVDDAIDETIAKIKDDVRRMRYDNGTGYFWINDNGKPVPKMVMHPTVPDLDGKILDDLKFNSARGKGENLFVAAVDEANTRGEGFVDYVWPKPTANGLLPDAPKLSYVRLYEPLGWVVGSGVYIDDIDEEVTKKTKSIDSQIMDLIQRLLGGFLAVVAGMALIFFFVSRKEGDEACKLVSADQTDQKRQADQVQLQKNVETSNANAMESIFNQTLPCIEYLISNAAAKAVREVMAQNLGTSVRESIVNMGCPFKKSEKENDSEIGNEPEKLHG